MAVNSGSLFKTKNVEQLVLKAVNEEQKASEIEDNDYSIFVSKDGNEKTAISIEDSFDADDDNYNIQNLSQEFFGINEVGEKKLQDAGGGFYKTTVEEWNSKPTDDMMKYTNDCISRIVANYYSDSIDLYTNDYDALVNEICNINNIDNKDVLYAGQEIILPIPVYDENNALMGFISPDNKAPETSESTKSTQDNGSTKDGGSNGQIENDIQSFRC